MSGLCAWSLYSPRDVGMQVMKKAEGKQRREIKTAPLLSETNVRALLSTLICLFARSRPERREEEASSGLHEQGHF